MLVSFDERRFELARRFFETVLRHTAGEWYGKPFRLAPWQLDLLRAVAGRVDEEGRRVVRLAYLEVPKKSGKTELGAGLALWELLMSRERGRQIYVAAAGLRQTQNVFRACCKMVEQSQLLQRATRVLRGSNRIIRRDDPDSFVQAIPADGDLTDGVNPACVIADELHRWRTRKQQENWDVLLYGGLTRRESVVIALTTAGSRDESPLAWRLHERALSAADDPAFYGRIYACPDGFDWRTPEAWIAANPSLVENGGYLPLERIREAYELAHREPGGPAAFRRYYLNRWDEREDRRAIDMDDWDACAADWHDPGWPGIRSDHELLRRFVDRPCWLGLDLSLTTDISALVAVFPDGDGCDVLAWSWMPEGRLERREHLDGVPYRAWAASGYIELCPGEVISVRQIEERVRWAAEMFAVQEVCVDPWNSRQLTERLTADGFRCVEVRQSFAAMSAPTKRFLEMVKARRLRHGGNPVLRWHASCLTLQQDANDLVKPAKPDRERSRMRVDGVVATIIALARAGASAPARAVGVRLL